MASKTPVRKFAKNENKIKLSEKSNLLKNPSKATEFRFALKNSLGKF